MERQNTTWQDARKEVIKLNPFFAKIIDQLSPDKNLGLEVLTFNYGEEITGLNPFLVFEKSCEAYFEYNNQPMAYSIISPGEMAFFDTPLMQSNQNISKRLLFKITAGARNIFMLPQINDFMRHKKLLDAYGFEANRPRELSEHWRIFKSIATSKAIKSNWRCRVLVFSENWFKHENDPLWQPFYAYLMQQKFKNNNLPQQLNILISILQHEKPFKISLAEAEQINHYFMIGLGLVPGFAPAQNDEALPTRLIQEAYLEKYHLKNYAPIVMQPKFLNLDNPKESIYYSMSHPCYYYFTPNIKYSAITKELYQYSRLLKKLEALILSKNFIDETSKIYQFTKAYKADFYHHVKNNYFQNTAILAEQDPNFMNKWKKEKLFPEKNSFFSGCIRISQREPLK